MSKNKFRFIPLLVSIALVFGIFIGSFFASHFSGGKLNIVNMSNNKLNDLLHIIDDQYVDSVNIPKLIDKSIPLILQQLDPHSSYFSAKNVESSMEELNGSFSGVGIQFSIINDTVCVLQVIKGGPAEDAGIMAGDKIIAVNNHPYVGKQVSNEKTLKLFKGKKGEKVVITVKRANRNHVFTVVRGNVPLKSIECAYMLTENIGYIQIKAFGENTYPEFLSALAQLNTKGMNSLVLDLRNNTGGYMNTAVQIANEFLPKGRLIVYTKGRKSPREEYRSNGKGSYQNLPLVILVNELSASASEILSGAIQDNDRGLIIGRRTFGKGLVQIPIIFNDGSMLRITKARYYTPSGRCVQKPYTPGDELDYENDLEKRAIDGEFFHADSIKTFGIKYKTRLGRVVYGGGGIIPDIFIPSDTTGITSYFQEVYMKGLINQFAFIFTEKYRNQLSTLNNIEDIERFIMHTNLVRDFVKYAQFKGVKKRNLLVKQSARLLIRSIVAGIIEDNLGTSAYVRYMNKENNCIRKAIEILNKGESFPTINSLANNQRK